MVVPTAHPQPPSSHQAPHISPQTQPPRAPTMSVPAITTLSQTPEATHITLLFKHHKSTTLLSVSPTQSLSSIKSLLHSVLKSRSIPSLPNPEDIDFGVPIDKKDTSKGWKRIGRGAGGSEGESGGGGRSKAGRKGKGKVTDKDDVTGDTPEQLGLGDGSIVAYRFRGQSERDARGDEEGNGDEENGDGDGMEVDVGGDEGEWDVVMPTFEEDEEEREARELDAMIDEGVNGR